MHSHLRPLGQPNRHGFTLVEILIVVVILGILAAIVIPQFTSATEESRNNSLRMNLHRIRTQLQIYKQQHNAWPALTTFAEQLTMASNTAGVTAAPGTDGYEFGPYVTEIPANPRNGLNTVADTEVGTSGWYYDETTGEFLANDSAESREF